ncbi:MAG: MATE family efflux transporter, partial [Lachnospiraceae bacterium]|nr:MATE family efflux transporter [Lachnospiraceae bacterium]
MKLYDKKQIDRKNILFDNRTLFWLLLPIIIEQFLNSLMGMVDTMMVSTVGSEAISAVSLVDSINNLVIQIFAAMASGATIICSQYIGGGNKQECNRAAGQVVLTVSVISLSIAAFCILGGEKLLWLVFGTVEDSVMENASVYFMITAISYPFLALFSAGA